MVLLTTSLQNVFFLQAAATDKLLEVCGHFTSSVPMGKPSLLHTIPSGEAARNHTLEPSDLVALCAFQNIMNMNIYLA